MINSLLLKLCCAMQLAGLFLGAPVQAALTEKRVALVIGNAHYKHSPHLNTPANDAKDLSSRLRHLGFTVIEKTDLTAEGFADSMASFSTMLASADVALLYFAGHGLQFRGENYLVPVDARLKNQFTLKRETFPVRDIIDQMETKARINLIFLEASRNNPLSENLRRTMSASRSTQLEKGLGPIANINGDTLVVYAAAAGAEALDGKGRNSPFMNALLKHIATPGLDVEVMLKRVAGTVRKTTGQYQKPERLSRLTSEFYFNRVPGRGRAENLAKNLPESRFDKLNKRISNLREQLEKQQKPRLIPELVTIPGGTFSMGCQSTKKCQSDETPVHAVRLKGFKMTKFEITFAEFDACVAQGGCRARPKDQGWGRGDRPVINVSWYDALAYAKWLGKKTGKTWRLPSEAEWEYAARAGTTTPWSFGNSIDTTQANFDYQLKKTAPVGQYPANRFGLHDMHGNVWEWVADRYDKSWYKSSPISNPQGPSKGSSRVFRGGSWLYKADNLRSSDRNSYSPDFRSKNIGFRLVREP